MFFPFSPFYYSTRIVGFFLETHKCVVDDLACILSDQLCDDLTNQVDTNETEEAEGEVQKVVAKINQWKFLIGEDE